MAHLSSRRHILILSRKCPHSGEVYDLVTQSGCGDLVQFVWVEDRTVRIPAYVTCTPFLLTDSGHKYTENDLFFFVQRILPSQLAQTHDKNTARSSATSPAAADGGSEQSPENEPQPFVTKGMEVGFSQAFSFLDDATNDTYCKQDAALSDYQKIECPPDDSVKIRKNADNALDRLRQQRERDIQGIVSPSAKR